MEEKLNYRFLSYNKYENFLQDKEDILPDTIVFIKDKRCIWARGNEYAGNLTLDYDKETHTATLKTADGETIVEFTDKTEEAQQRIADNTALESKINADLEAERIARSSKDTDIEQRLGEEINTRQQDDSNLSDRITNLENFIEADNNHVINKFNEIVAFLNDIAEPETPEDTLANIIETIDNKIKTKVSEEEGRADTVEIGLREDLNEEISRAKQAEKDLADNITDALEQKADISQLRNYITKDAIEDAIKGKQNKLTPGEGISIDENNVISTTLDTDVFVVVSELPTVDINPNKIYITEETAGGQTKYLSYKWNGTEWVSMGEKLPTIDLSTYLKTSDAANTYQPIGDYVTNKQLSDVVATVDDIYQKKITANYAQVGYVNAQIESLQRIIGEQYVLKKDVYAPKDDNWSEPEIVHAGDTTIINPDQGNSSSVATNMVTLSASAYQTLVDAGAVQSNVYYFTYEDEEETTSWTFGGTFPIIFSQGDGIGTFPITLI